MKLIKEYLETKKLVLVITVLIICLSTASLLLAIEGNSRESSGSVFADSGESNSSDFSLNSKFLPIRDWTITEPEIEAESAAIFDLTDEKFIYQKNIKKELPIASLTKIMTALVVLENLNLDDTIIISEEALKAEGIQGGLVAGETLSIKNLLYIMLVESSNDAAIALADAVADDFISLMNKKALSLGLENTYFAEPTGISKWNYSTASDLAKIIKHSLTSPLIWEILEIKEIEIFSEDSVVQHGLLSTNKLLETISDLVGGKTGFTEEAGGCLITLIKISEKTDRYFTTIILGSKNRELESKKLIEWAQKAYIW